MNTTQNNLQQILQSTNDWQDAACKVIDVYTSEGRPFSSGEIARELRVHRPDLVFSQYNLGNFIKDLHWNQSIRYTDAVGNPIYAFQVPRITTGKWRSPAGSQVFVYSPTIATGAVHDFEVEIPEPPSKQTNNVVQFNNNTRVPVSVEKGFATVQGDNRMRMPRCVLDEFSHLSGLSIRPTDNIYVKVENDKIYLSFLNSPNFSVFSVTHDKGAMKFYSPDMNVKFTPGERYPVEVTKNEIIINL